MDILLMIVTGVVCGIVATLTARREGVGWWVGDQVSALLGAGLGTYMVNTIHMGKLLDYYYFWIVAVSAGSALFMLMFSNWLLGGEEEDVEPIVVKAAEPAHEYLEYEPAAEEEQYPLRRAA